MKGLNIIVVGSGMYVCGRGVEGFGTIMPAIFEWSKNNSVSKVVVLSRTADGARKARAKIAGLKKIMGAKVDIECRRSQEGKRFDYAGIIRTFNGPSCAIISVPDHVHYEAAKGVMSSGAHALVVKPLTPTLREAMDLVKLQKKCGVYGAVEFHKRFDDANIKLRDVIQKAVIGQPLAFSIQYSQRKNVPMQLFRKWVRHTNVFQYLGVHYADIIYFATKAVPIRVSATGQNSLLVSEGVPAYDSIEAAIEWRGSNGKVFTSNFLTSWVDPESTTAMSDQRISVIGTRGRLESDQKRRGLMIVTDAKGIEEPNPYFCAGYGEPGEVFYRGYGIDSICTFLDDVIKLKNGLTSIKDLEKIRPTFKQALVSTAIVEAVNKSLSRGGAWVRINRIDGIV